MNLLPEENEFKKNRYQLISEQKLKRGDCYCNQCNRGPLQTYNDERRSYLVVTRIIPKDIGGTDEIDNLEIICGDCYKSREDS